MEGWDGARIGGNNCGLVDCWLVVVGIGLSVSSLSASSQLTEGWRAVGDRLAKACFAMAAPKLSV